MTRSEMKAMAAAGNSNWEVLTEVIRSGFEFPDAVWEIRQALRLDADEVEQMKRDYDECI